MIKNITEIDKDSISNLTFPNEEVLTTKEAKKKQKKLFTKSCRFR